MKHINLPILILMLFIGCSNPTTKISERPSLNIFEDKDPAGLPFWTADTIKKIKPELVALMDTLYRYVLAEDFQQDCL